ncbi:heterokaryon incompatibility protein-domain-containing protein [Pseudomassariella vexata]|uniref:Heterokaryon incompatibility protein-domain-containing protein n=1 Tax=Pseudomassariella vexata TaxID=1141098 RepID=A0A1Y2EK56_9PEZI|nr:heterokaryon incompatibility protein-domain-containing protein [Pseudomassariella vexata]ORY71929.1 heterokaryon incompatibility protein-domain-containing protein [Pseudomassariella vexata]
MAPTLSMQAGADMESSFNDLHGLPVYEYKPLHSMRRRIRLLRLVPGGLNNPEITCELFEVEYDQNNIIRKVGTGSNKFKDRSENGGQDENESMLYDDDVVEYEALSWCWGMESKDCGIRIITGSTSSIGTEHHRLAITRELILALKYLRHPRDSRFLWIDALWIDQANHEERNHQVQMMSRIYNCSKQVCVWLGENNDDSATAISFISEIMKLENFDSISEKRENAPKWQSLLLLMQRPWFSRRWVVQEIALARAATVYCGSDQISWEHFAVAVELFVEVETATHRLSEVMQKDEAFGHVPRWFEHVSELGASVLVQATGKVFRQDGTYAAQLKRHMIEGSRFNAKAKANLSPKMTKGQKKTTKPKPLEYTTQRPLLSLEYLVSSLSVFEASQPRDAVYSLLAIARDTSPFAELRTVSLDGSEEATIMSTVSSFLERKPFRVDYSRPYSDVCKDFVSFCIQGAKGSDGTRALDILCRPWAPDPIVTSTTNVPHKKPVLYKFQENREALHGKWERSRKLKNGQEDTKDMEKYFNDAQKWLDENKPKRRGPRAQKNTEKTPTVSPATSTKQKRGRGGGEEDLHLPSWVSRISGASFALYHHAGSMRRMGRRNADPLVGLPLDGHRNYSAVQNTKVDLRSENCLRFRKRPKVGHGHYSLYTKGFVLAEIDEVNAPSRGGQIPETWAQMAGWEDAVDGESDPPAEFWRTLVADRGKDNRNPPYYYATACKESVKKGGLRGGSVDTGALINSERNSIVAEFCRRVQAVIWNRCLIKVTTKTIGSGDNELKILGLANQNVKPKDFVCIMDGCSVPVILRRGKKKNPDDLEKECMQDAVEAMKSAMSICEEACFRKLRYKKKLNQIKRDEGQESMDLWKKEVEEEKAALDRQISQWKEKQAAEKKKRTRKSAKRKRMMKTKNEDKGKAPEVPAGENQSEELTEQATSRGDSEDAVEKNTEEVAQEKSPEELAREKAEKEGQARKNAKKQAKEDDPYFYYTFMGEAYIHGMMDGEAVRLHITEGLPDRVFEIR